MKSTAKKSIKKTITTNPLKKSNEKPIQENFDWRAIHIFGSGESQIVADDKNGSVQNDTLKTLQPLLAMLSSKQQKGTKVSMEDTHAINIINGLFVDFLPKLEKNNSQRFMWDEVDEKTIDKFSKELSDKVASLGPKADQTKIKNLQKDLTSKRKSA